MSTTEADPGPSSTERPRPDLFDFDNTYVRDLPELGVSWSPDEVPEPSLVVLNDALAASLGADPELLRSADGAAALAGSVVPQGAEPVAMAYAGHQFGHYSPRLGDGRAVLWGEVVDVAGVRRDLHLKGSGRTPFARGGDGKAAIGPMLREYLIAEALAALGVPTTRALAVATTGEQVYRDAWLPGAVLTRVASSHLRVGTFEYAARLGGADLLRRLADVAIARHHPQAAEAERPYLAFFESVADAQARLVAAWMNLGFVHGVQNTDNTTISGESIDFGPCAFMDRHDPATVYSSIDHGGRYAYANQPPIVQWNLARLAETLVPLVDDDSDRAVELLTEALVGFGDRYAGHRDEGMRAKLGLRAAPGDERALYDDLFELMHAQQADHTGTFRALATSARGDDVALLTDGAFDGWLARWHAALDADGRSRPEVADAMDLANPIYVPRNHLVEEALTAATAGDLGPFHRLAEVLADPFTERPDLDRYAEPAPEGFDDGYQTFCGT